MWTNNLHDRIVVKLYIVTIFVEVNSAIIIKNFLNWHIFSTIHI